MSILLFPSLVFSASSDDYQTGLELYHQKQYKQSLVYFQLAVEDDSNNWQAYQAAGDVYKALGDSQTALVLWGKSLAIHPANPALNESVGQLSQHPESPAAPITFESVRYHPLAEAYTDWPSDQFSPPHWLKLSGAFAFASQGDLNNGVQGWANEAASTGMAVQSNQAGNTGWSCAAEAGFALDPRNGIALSGGALFMPGFNGNTSDNIGDSNTVHVSSKGFDGELAYYHYWPGSDGRFYLRVGAGVYAADVGFSQGTVTSGNSGTTDTNGDYLYGTVPEGSLEFGYDFKIDKFFLTVYIKGRYADVPSVTASFNYPNGGYGNYSLAVFPEGNIGLALTSSIGSNGIRYATLDFSGVEGGIGLGLYYW
jgi:hypothetical protein